MATSAAHGTDASFPPTFGLGTWRSDAGRVRTIVKDALELGYRHLDCAWVYENENEVGQGIADFLAIPEQKVKREEIFVTSKLWLNRFAPENVEGGLKETLANLGLEYLDLYLMHWPVAFKNVPGSSFPKVEATGEMDFDVLNLRKTWEALEKLVDAGLVKHLGVSNFDERDLTELLKFAKHKPVTNQIEAHPYLQQKELTAFCATHGISITSYCPLGNLNPSDDAQTTPLTDPVIAAIAKKHAKSPAQVLLRWNVQSGRKPIPKTVTPSRLRENLDSLAFDLDQEDLDAIGALDRDVRFCNPRFRTGGNFFPRNYDAEAPFRQVEP